MTTKREEEDIAGTVGELARNVLAFETARITPAAFAQAKLLLLDTIGCGIAGMREDTARAVAEAIGTSSPQECVLIGRNRKVSMLDAVLANGAAIRVLDLNDYLINMAGGEPETGGHPSDNIPVALAAGAVRSRAGLEILASIVVAYELYARLQQAMDRGGKWDGVSVSGLVATAIAGRLMGLDEARIAHALALGLARAPTPAIVRRGHISSAKSIANALVAQSGVQAALLAEKGVTGPLAILDNEYGLRDLFPQSDRKWIARPFPFDGAILRAHVKTYPCVNTGQSAVATALALRKMLTCDPGALAKIELTMADYRVVERQQTDPGRIRPRSRESADHSFPFIVAVSLIDGTFGLAQYENERWHDTHVVALMEKIVMTRDNDLRNRTADGFPCTIRAWDDAGREYVAGSVDPAGFPMTGLDPSGVIAKFHALCEPIFSRSRRERIVDAVMDFDQSSSTEKLDTAIASEEITT